MSEGDSELIITSFVHPTNSNIEVFTTSNVNTGDIVDFIEIDWDLNEAQITNVYWEEKEVSDLSVEGIEFSQGEDFIDIALAQAEEQQSYQINSRVRGFGWTCGPVVESPGGNFRTCCHRIFWRRTQPCNQYGAGHLPGKNPRIVSISQ
ncbi:hypothetical protein [Nonlabens sp. Asnod3-A02]|uniref:hypothetical protein n=1 Tax=Nonlabens sp. Asnod3-A02 TaxID=3160579 RepID=UPI0038635644